MYSNCPETKIKEYILGRFLASVCEREKETLRKKEGKKERENRHRKKTDIKKKRTKERTNGRTDGRTYERKYAGSTFRRKLFCCLSKNCATVLVIVVVKV